MPEYKYIVASKDRSMYVSGKNPVTCRKRKKYTYPAKWLEDVALYSNINEARKAATEAKYTEHISFEAIYLSEFEKSIWGEWWDHSGKDFERCDNRYKLFERNVWNARLLLEWQKEKKTKK